MKKSLENFSAALKSQKISSASSVNYCQRVREGLETQPECINFTLFVSGSDIPDITLATAKSSKTSYALWQGHCWHVGIKNSTPTAHSLCKYTWEVILYMVFIGKNCLRPDIQPETADQTGSTEDMMRLVGVKEAHYWQKANRRKTIALSPSGQEGRHVSLLTSYYLTIILLIWAQILDSIINFRVYMMEKI